MLRCFGYFRIDIEISDHKLSITAKKYHLGVIYTLWYVWIIINNMSLGFSHTAEPTALNIGLTIPM